MATQPPPKFSYRFASFLVKYRYLFLSLCLLATASATFYSFRVGFTHEIDIWFLDDDPQVGNYDWYKTTFPSDEFVLLALETKNPFSPKDFPILRELSQRLESITIRRYPAVWGDIESGIELALTGVKPPPWRPIYRVISFSTVKHAINRWDRDTEVDEPKIGSQHRFWLDEPSEEESWAGVFKIEKFVVKSPQTDADARYLLKKALENERIRSSLISRTGDYVAVIGVVHKDFEEFYHKKQLSDAIAKLQREIKAKYGRQVHAAGMFLFGVEFQRLSRKDQTQLMPALLGMIVLILFGLFRRPGGVIIPALVMFVSVGWVRGFMGTFHIDDNVVGSMIAPLLIAVGIADSVHYYSEYRHFLTKMSKREAVVNAVGSVLRPCFFTSLTTAVGFASLLTSSLLPMRQFGMLAAVGVVIAFVLSTLALPMCLDFLREPKSKTVDDGEGSHTMAGWLHLMSRLTELVRTYPKTIFIFSASCVIASLFGVVKVRLETNDLEFIRKTNPKRVALDLISDRFGGVAPVEIVFDTGAKNGAKDPAFLAKLDELHNWLLKDVGVVQQVTSLVDFIKEFRGTYMGGAESEYHVPATRAEVGQLLTQLEGDSGQMSDFVDFNYRYARVSVKTKVLGSHQQEHLLETLSRRLTLMGFTRNRGNVSVTVAKTPEQPRESGSKNGVKPQKASIPFVFTGLISLFVKMENYLLSSQVRSFSLALGIICLLMMIQLRSFFLGVIAMVPNIFPLFIYLAVMGALGINLDVGTAMISSIAIGISVDDTIHFMERHARKVRVENKSYELATAETFAESGQPIVMTSVILLIGFLTLMFGSFVPTINFGLLTAITIVAALYADLFLLPVLIAWLKPYR
ncbi:MAG: MMPL family transporter [Myxococcales bacterium]|nr:MMPL family transporter [Myxococcales bacterium]